MACRVKRVVEGHGLLDCHYAALAPCVGCGGMVVGRAGGGAIQLEGRHAVKIVFGVSLLMCLTVCVFALPATPHPARRGRPYLRPT